jgi:hypothetical protein
LPKLFAGRSFTIQNLKSKIQNGITYLKRFFCLLVK